MLHEEYDNDRKSMKTALDIAKQKYLSKIRRNSKLIEENKGKYTLKKRNVLLKIFFKLKRNLKHYFFKWVLLKKRK